MDLSEAELSKLRQKLRFKVRFHVGSFCPDVEDLVQESMIRFVKAASEDAIHDPQRYGAFLNGVCNNVIREWRRRLWREPQYEVTAHGEPSVSGEGERMLVQDQVRNALSHLLPRDAAILREFFLEQKSKEEICRARGLTDGQFRVILFRAKQRFSTVYEPPVKHGAGEQH